MNRSDVVLVREPIRELGIAAARKLRAAIAYEHPNEIEIEVLAFMRGAVVRGAPVRGARANLIRVGDRGIIGISEGLTVEERRWAIAHELGHFEIHADVSFVGLCSSDDMRASYRAGGREPEANAFAAELLMPADLFAPKCDVARVSWDVVRGLAKTFVVSTTAAALRFVALTDERVAVVCMKEGVIEWTIATKDFGTRPQRGARVGEWTEAYDFFHRGIVSDTPQTVSASAWLDEDGIDDEELVEHVFASPHLRSALSLLWRKS
jgi:Zn-dependent peptidase ImmA (M78 family)